jgi:hypothetical protein
MIKPSLKNIALNWTFNEQDFEDFKKNQWLIIDKIPGMLRILEAFFLFQTALNLRGKTNKFIDVYTNVYIDDNLFAATKIEVWPYANQRANKRRVFWAMKTGFTNPFLNTIYMIYYYINKPFGSIKNFFTNSLSVQEIK